MGKKDKKNKNTILKKWKKRQRKIENQEGKTSDEEKKKEKHDYLWKKDKKTKTLSWKNE